MKIIPFVLFMGLFSTSYAPTANVKQCHKTWTQERAACKAKMDKCRCGLCPKIKSCGGTLATYKCAKKNQINKVCTPANSKCQAAAKKKFKDCKKKK